MSSSTGPVVVESRSRGPQWLSSICPYCKADIEYIKPASLPAASTTPGQAQFQIRCCKCSQTYNGPITREKKTKIGRSIGTDDKPLETEYYEILGVTIQATDQEIKTAYRRLAIKHHPDKNPNDPNAEDRFKKIAVAYTTLSDPVTRHKYNEFGASAGKGGEDQVVDPEAVFSTLFGGEKFQEIIGTISLGQEMKAAMQEDGQEEEEEEVEEVVPASQLVKPGQPMPPPGATTVIKTKRKKVLTPEQKAKKAEAERKIQAERSKARDERVTKLMKTLVHKIAIYTEQVTQGHQAEVAKSVRIKWLIEAQELKDESYGVELLNVVGETYKAKSKHHLAASGTPFGIGGWWHGARNTAHVLGETYSTVRSALELKAIFEELQKAEETGMPEEKKKELEEKAATKGLAALFKSAKLEVESVLREVCERVLTEKGLSEIQLGRRAEALQILGEVYASIRKDDGTLGSDADYIKINDKTPHAA